MFFRSLRHTLAKRSRRYRDIDPDEILIDAKNLPAFDTARLEGRIERPLSPVAFKVFFAVAALLAALLAARLVYLEIIRYPTLAARAEANTLNETPLIAPRGRITDRSGILLADTSATGSPEFAARLYPLGAAAANLVGYVSYPKRDKNGVLYQNRIEGVVGIEAAKDEALSGKNGVAIVETNASGKRVSGSIVRPPRAGADIRLSIDAPLQQELYDELRSRADLSSWRGGTGIIMDVATGELLAVASYPSFDPGAMSSGQPSKEVAALLADPRSPFLDRAVSGLYTPGSVVKPYVAAAALQEGVIAPDKQILSTGSISVQNPYDPKHPSIFRDWRPNGWVDMRHAIAVSSDVYFYEVGGGYSGPDGPDQEGLGIANIEKYMRGFGFGAPTGVPLEGEERGVIPDPLWKAETFGGEQWFLGDTYHTAIGQYGFKITPMQLVRAVAALANGGALVTPVIEAGAEGARARVPVPPADLAVVREGMRLCVAGGICGALAVPGVEAAAKTGTAQVGARNEYVNSLVEGFFPYQNPRYAFVVVMEQAKAGTLQGAPAVMGSVLSWLVANRSDMTH